MAVLGDSSDNSSDMGSDRSSRITVRRYASASEADRHDAEYWMQMSDAERVLEVWRLSQELFELRGDAAYESGLSRSITRVHRR